MTTHASRLFANNKNPTATRNDEPIAANPPAERPKSSAPESSNLPPRRATPKANDANLHSKLSPGNVLRTEREQRGMTLNHVAERLYLNSNVIQALEQDAYEDLPAPTFVRGYIRNYAKLMEINPEPLVEAYTQLTQAIPPPITPHRTKEHASTVHTDAWWFRWGLPVLVVTVLVFGVLWQFYPGGTSLPNSTSHLPNAGNEQLTTNLASSNNNTAPSMGLTTPETDPTPAYTYTPPDENASNDASVMLMNNGGVDSNAETAADQTTDATIVGEESEGDESAAAAPVDTTLRIIYGRDSWTRVIDSADNRLYVGVKRNGQTLEVDGKPPYTVRFGVLRNITVEYQGQKTEAESYPQRRGRTLTIGSSEETQP